MSAAGDPEDIRPDGKDAEPNYIKAAFRSQYNWIGIVGATAFAVISGSALPLLLAAGLELMYLSIIPQNPRYQRLVRSRKYLEARRRAEERLRAAAQRLPEDMRRRYAGLEAVCQGIRSNYAQLSSTSQIFARQMEERLEGLSQGFLRLLVAAQMHRDYLESASPEEIQEELAQLKKTLEADPPKVQEINRRRIEILEKRLEKFGKIQENHQVIEAQCSAMEDVLELIRDQSVTMKDPQQVSDQLGDLVRDVEQTEEAVREVEAVFEVASPELSVPLAAPADVAPAPNARKKIRN